MNIILVDSLDQETWREFVNQHPQGNIFHTPEMFQVFTQSKGYRPGLWAAIDENHQILALHLPVQICLKNGLLRRLTTRSIAYGSVLCLDSPPGHEALGALLRSYSRETGGEALFSELRNLSDVGAIQPVLAQCGFAYEDHLNYLIDLNGSVEQVMQRIGSRTRKHIRQGLRKGTVTVEFVNGIDQIKTWYELVQKTYLAAHVPLADRSLFEAAYKILQPRGMIRFWLARIGTAYVAASVELLYKDVMYGWYGGVDRAFANETPGELLMYHILQWGVENGYRIYDFGGAGKPGEAYGVRDYKAKFGGQLVCYGRNTKVYSPSLLHWSERGYEIYRRLNGRF